MACPSHVPEQQLLKALCVCTRQDTDSLKKQLKEAELEVERRIKKAQLAEEQAKTVQADLKTEDETAEAIRTRGRFYKVSVPACHAGRNGWHSSASGSTCVMLNKCRRAGMRGCCAAQRFRPADIEMSQSSAHCPHVVGRDGTPAQPHTCARIALYDFWNSDTASHPLCHWTQS